ncbi:MAG: hypothetical protein OHK0017_00980 [Patescibacteria group bacterium]
MSRKFKFKFPAIKQSIITDETGFYYLKHYFDALHVVYPHRHQFEIISDMSSALYQKIVTFNSTLYSADQVLSSLADTLGISQSELQTKIVAPKDDIYLDSSRAVIGGVCDLIARIFQIPTWFVRFVMLCVLFATGGYAINAYLILWILLPTKRSVTEDLFIKLLTEQAHTSIFDQDEKANFTSWYTKFDRAGKAIAIKVASLGLLIGSLIAAWYAFFFELGLILQRSKLWPDVLWIQSDINFLNDEFFYLVVILQLIGMVAISWFGLGLSRALIKQLILPNLAWQRYLAGLVLGVMLLGASTWILDLKRPAAPEYDTKVIAMQDAPKLVLNNNSFCDTNGIYQVVVRRSSDFKTTIYGPKTQLSNLTLDYYDNQHILTHIYPLRTCWMNTTSKVNLVIETPKPVTLEDWTSSPVTVIGFSKDEVKVKESRLQPLYTD